MEELGPLLLLNDNIITALPNKVGDFCVFKYALNMQPLNFCLSVP